MYLQLEGRKCCTEVLLIGLIPFANMLANGFGLLTSWQIEIFSFADMLANGFGLLTCWQTGDPNRELVANQKT